jgi:ribosome-binding protein aMBF1 (putative translation factor)
MNAILPTPIEITDATVTLSRADWERHIDHLEELSVRASVARSLAERARLGDAEYTRLAYTSHEARRVIDGASFITIWRERAGLSQRQLSANASISPSYLAEIEAGKKPGSLAATAAIAKALGVPIDILVG